MRIKRWTASFLAILLTALVLTTPLIYAENPSEYALTNKYDGSTVNTGKDNGYSGAKAIGTRDVHYNWILGQFVLKGYTEVLVQDGVPVFLVNPGDSIELSYKLLQNIDMLNGNKNLTISNDKNGYDKAFQIEKTSFGRGALLVKFTDHNNHSRVTPHLDYLTLVKNGSSNATVSDLEEGDYEVALDYEIAEKLFPGYRYNDYRTTCRFKIRNSNCMIYLRDIGTKSEYANYSVAEEGFFLEYTSFYQRIVVKREILADNGEGYALTPRACKAAFDSAQYTDPGIYTVTVKNVYTNESVEMVIAVGDDPLTNAYVTAKCTYKPDQLAEMLDSGKATITDDWRIEMKETPAPTAAAADEKPVVAPTEGAKKAPSGNTGMIITIAVVALVAVAGAVVAVIRKRKPEIRPELDDYKVGKVIPKESSEAGDPGETTEDIDE